MVLSYASARGPGSLDFIAHECSRVDTARPDCSQYSGQKSGEGSSDVGRGAAARKRGILCAFVGRCARRLKGEGRNVDFRRHAA